MNKQQSTNCTTGSKSRSMLNKNKVKGPSKIDSTSGSYITYVNLYLHPNASSQPIVPNEQGIFTDA